MALPLVVRAASSPVQEYRDAVASAPDVQQGAVLFASCAVCHGADGAGDARRTIPRIAGQLQKVIIGQLVDYRSGRRIDPSMEGVARGHRLLVAQDIADIAAFVAALPKMSSQGPPPAEFLARCSSCHGPDAEGDETMRAPRLAGQHQSYLLRQMDSALDGRRPDLAASHGEMLRKLDQDALVKIASALSAMQ